VIRFENEYLAELRKELLKLEKELSG